MVNMYLLLSVILILSVVLLFHQLFFYSKKVDKFTESFLEQEVTYEIDENEYSLDQNHAFKEQCVNALIKPDDVHFTNVLHFMNIENAKFVGISTDKRYYMVLSKNLEVYNIDLIPNDGVIAYAYERDKILFDQLFKKAYSKPMRFESMSAMHDENVNKEVKFEFVNDYCNSFDISKNLFIDFMESNYEFLGCSFNIRYDAMLFGYFTDFFSKRVKQLKLIAQNSQDPYIKHKIHDYVFRSVLKEKHIEVDDVLFTTNHDKINYTRLISNNLIDFDASQQYMDLYHCDVPTDLLNHFNQDNVTTTIKQEDLRNTPDSCKSTTKIKNLENSSKNIFGRHVYKSTRCGEDYKNLFIDILFPFSSDYDIKLSPDDFNTLKIHSNKFDDYIPIRNAFSYNNFNISR